MGRSLEKRFCGFFQSTSAPPKNPPKDNRKSVKRHAIIEIALAATDYWARTENAEFSYPK